MLGMSKKERKSAMVNKGKKFRVLSVDQFDAHNYYMCVITKLNFKKWENARKKNLLPLQMIKGSNKAAIFTVGSPDSHPMKGRVWFRSVRGRFRLYKSNPDSSGN